MFLLKYDLSLVLSKNYVLLQKNVGACQLYQYYCDIIKSLMLLQWYVRITRQTPVVWVDILSRKMAPNAYILR